MSGYTKGPWEWKDDDRDKFGLYRIHPGVLATNLSDGTPWGDDIDKANAHLIAAAPELLEALDNVVKACFHYTGEGQEDYVQHSYYAAIAAIKKAKGE